jgi:hypothetical protein
LPDGGLLQEVSLRVLNAVVLLKLPDQGGGWHELFLGEALERAISLTQMPQDNEQG